MLLCLPISSSLPKFAQLFICLFVIVFINRFLVRQRDAVLPSRLSDATRVPDIYSSVDPEDSSGFRPLRSHKEKVTVFSAACLVLVCTTPLFSSSSGLCKGENMKEFYRRKVRLSQDVNLTAAWLSSFSRIFHQFLNMVPTNMKRLQREKAAQILSLCLPGQLIHRFANCGEQSWNSYYLLFEFSCLLTKVSFQILYVRDAKDVCVSAL